jgi:hypothetical protein
LIGICLLILCAQTIPIQIEVFCNTVDIRIRVRIVNDGQISQFHFHWLNNEQFSRTLVSGSKRISELVQFLLYLQSGHKLFQSKIEFPVRSYVFLQPRKETAQTAIYAETSKFVIGIIHLTSYQSSDSPSRLF